jgi:hypothetical protein
MLKKIKQFFLQYINRVQALIALEKSYISYILTNRDIFYIKVIALNGIYKFLVLSFLIWGR